jgi:hypothetical protein
MTILERSVLWALPGLLLTEARAPAEAVVSDGEPITVGEIHHHGSVPLFDYEPGRQGALRGPRCPKTPIDTARPSVKVRSGRWQSTQARARSRESSASRRSRQAKLHPVERGRLVVGQPQSCAGRGARPYGTLPAATLSSEAAAAHG